jgi:(S)-ureidoglycine aminohydrolase
MRLLHLLIVVSLFIPVLSNAQNKIVSKAYNPGDLPEVKDENRMRRQFVDGSTTLLVNLEIHTSTVQGGEAPHPGHTHTDQEELVIIKEGTLTATVKGVSKTLGPGSVVYIVIGDEHGFRNAGTTPCTYYIIKYKKAIREAWDKTPMSFMVDWNDMKFVPHDKGGRRNVYDWQTKLFDRFEMHITTLNAGLTSHDPHSHAPEEIILIKSGEVEMNVGTDKVRSGDGGVVFLDSKVSHNLTNIGKEPATYFAFQWN